MRRTVSRAPVMVANGLSLVPEKESLPLGATNKVSSADDSMAGTTSIKILIILIIFSFFRFSSDRKVYHNA
jgi:hypothetical protein